MFSLGRTRVRWTLLLMNPLKCCYLKMNVELFEFPANFSFLVVSFVSSLLVSDSS